MSEDTRKDKRAKIVSLNVRYKSATVDEFIENHSLDVSKGGIFIKTPTPFPPGTLIKFEIRIANDKAVIMGVGRVVWKREAAQSAGDRPSGMGVKFIKIDDSSRSVIDRVVAEKEGAGSAYAAETEGGEGSIPGASRVPSERKVPTAVTPGVLRPGEIRKETIMGIGSATAQKTNPEMALPSGGGGMFPTSTSEPETGPVKEKTVMKQAAELLEEALKEAGGSMEEVGTNPLFAEGNRLQGRVGTAEQLNDKVKKGTLVGLQAPTSQGAQPAATPVPAKDAQSGKTPAATIKDAPDPPAAKLSSSPSTTRESPSAKVLVSEPTPKAAPKPGTRTDPPAARKPAPAVLPPEDDFTRPKKSGGGVIWVIGILLVAGGVAFIYKDNLLGGGEPPPAPTASAPIATTPAPIPTPTVSAAPTPAPSASAAPSASTTPSPSASAVPSPSASATPAASSLRPSVSPAGTTPPPSPVPNLLPKPAPTPTAKATATPTATATATVAPTPKPTATAAPTPATDTSGTDSPAPKPKPKPKPTAAPDDNPY